MNTDTELLRKLVKLAEKATPGPWHTDDYLAYVWGPKQQMVADTNGDPNAVVRMRGLGANLPIKDNLAFILAARNAMPALSRLLEAQAGVPEGWKLVPIEPTDAMKQACDNTRGPMTAWKAWQVMIAAAPNHPPSEGEKSENVF